MHFNCFDWELFIVRSSKTFLLIKKLDAGFKRFVKGHIVKSLYPVSKSDEKCSWSNGLCNVRNYCQSRKQSEQKTHDTCTFIDAFVKFYIWNLLLICRPSNNYWTGWSPSRQNSDRTMPICDFTESSTSSPARQYPSYPC